MEKPTDKKIPSTKVEMAGKPTNVKIERMPQSTKSDSSDVFSTKLSKNIVENTVQVKAVEFVLVYKYKISLENNVEEMGGHQKQESKENAKRKRKSLEESQEDVRKLPKKSRKSGKLENLCPKKLCEFYQ